MRQLRWTSIKWSVLRGICAVIVPGKSRRLSQLSVRVGIWLNYQKRFNEPSETVGGGWQENLGDWKIKSTISGEKRSRISNSTLNFFLEIPSGPVLWTWWERNNTVWIITWMMVSGSNVYRAGPDKRYFGWVYQESMWSDYDILRSDYLLTYHEIVPG